MDWKRVLILASTMIVLQIYLPSNGYFEHVLKLFTLYALTPILILCLLKERLSEYGVNLDVRKRAVLLSIFLVLISFPLMVWSSRLEGFRQFYPYWSPARYSLENFAFYELSVLVLVFSTEFFFRGFLLLPFEKLQIWSILPQLLPYAVLHFGKPMLEVWASLCAGVAFGYMAFKTKSIVPSFIAHYSIALIFDILVMT